LARASTSPTRSLCPLWGEPGAIITPHNSGKFSLPKTLDNIVDIFIHNLKRYAEGLPLDNQVNRTTRYAADQNGGHRLLSTL
jgi:phosphoglycerate dehydrogenase-like enzyme